MSIKESTNTKNIGGVEIEALKRESRGIRYWVPMVVETGKVLEDNHYSSRPLMWEDLKLAAKFMGDSFSSRL